MKKSNSMRSTGIWLCALVLFVCVAVTTVASTGIMSGYLPDDSGAISLIPEETVEKKEESVNSPVAESTRPQQTVTQIVKRPSSPQFEVVDDQTVWSTNTLVEIFRVSYENGEQEITVQSDDGDKLIAPGTENSYTFKLKNTGDVALDYTVWVDAYFTPEDSGIPISARLSRYDSAWIVGSKDSYGTVDALDQAEDSSALGAGNYVYYTLDWQWPFESGDDSFDTLLGNRAIEEDLTFSIVITTVAVGSDDPYNDSGITPPQTGDNSNLALWIALAAGSFVLMIILLICQRKEKQSPDEEANNF